MDGNREDRSDTVSVFNGPPPEIQTFATEDEEARAVGSWIADLVRTGTLPHSVGIFVRSTDQLPRAQAAAIHSGYPVRVLDDQVESGFHTPAEALGADFVRQLPGVEFRWLKGPG